jgi:capsular exopolysaccharide synthesis family protein
VDVKESSPYFIQRISRLPDMTSEASYTALPPEDGTRVDLRQYWRTIRRHLWLASSVPLAFVVLIAIHDLMATRLYTAQATILIKNNAPQVYASVDVAAGNGTSESQWNVNTKTEYTLLRTRSVAEKVILAEGLRSNPVFAGLPSGGASGQRNAKSGNETVDDAYQHVPPEVINRYLGGLKVTPLEETELVVVSFTTSNAELAARLANAHVREFIQQRIELNSQASDQAAQFLEKKLAQLKRQVEESELALNNYRRDKGIIPGLISVNGQDVVLGRLDKLSDQVQQAHLKNLTFETQVALITQGHADALPAIINSKMVESLKENLDTLQTQDASMSGRFKADYPPMAELSAKIKATREALRREVASIVASINAQYAASLKDERALDDELKGEKDLALGLNDAGVRYAILQREADTNKQLYNAVLKRMKDVEVTADLHASNVSVVDRATAPSVSSSPREARDLLAAALLGLMAGIGLTFLIEQHDDTFKDSGEVESYLRVPLLGTIPDFRRLRGPAYGPRALRSPDPSKLLSSANGTVPSYGSHSPVGETYRMLRTALLLSRAGAPPKSVLIASAIPSEGKTTTAANLAIVLAGTGRRVLLVDADLRRSHCHELFGLENHLGLTESLTGVGEVVELIRPTGFGNLYLLSSGEMPPNPSELLGSDRMREVLVQLGEHYDSIIIDSAPITPVTDAVVLSSVVDGVILVADKQTARQRVRAALSRLEYAHAKVFGVVLNKVEPHNLDYNGYKSHYYMYEHNSKDTSGNTAAGE